MALSGSLSSASFGQAIQLSDRQGLDMLGGLVVVPGGTQAAYWMWDEQTGVRRYYAVPIDGSSAPVALGPDLTGTSEAYEGILFSPDGQHVTLLANHSGSYSDRSAYMLNLSSPTAATEIARTPLSDGLWRFYGYVGGDLVFLANPPAGSDTPRIVTASHNTPASPTLAAVLPVSTGTPQISNAAISDNGQWMAVTYNEIGHDYNLYSLRLDGSAPLRQLTNVGENEDAGIYAIAPDGQSVVYRTSTAGSTDRQYFLRNTDGSGAAHALIDDSGYDFVGGGVGIIGTEFVSGTNRLMYRPVDNPSQSRQVVPHSVRDFVVTSGGTHIVYRGPSINFSRLFSVDVMTPGAPYIPLDNTPVEPIGLDERTMRLERYIVSDNGQHVLYHNQNAYDDERVYVGQVGVAHGSTQLFGLFGADYADSNSQYQITTFAFTNDDSHVSFRVRTLEDNYSTGGLYIAPSDGSATAQQVFFQDPDVIGYTYNFHNEVVDGYALISTSFQTHTESRMALFAVPVDGGVPIRLHDPLLENGSLESIQYNQSTGRVVFSASTLVVEEEVPTPPNPSYPGGGTRIVYTRYNDIFAANLPTQALSLADLTGDFVLDINDADAFVLGLLEPDQYVFQFGLSPLHYAGLNGDDILNADDIEPLATLLGIDRDYIDDLLAQPLLGDLDADGDVDEDDIAIVVGNFTGSEGSHSLSLSEGDYDYDGDVDNADVGFVIGAYTGTLDSTDSINAQALSAAVPEPTSLAMLGLGGLMLVRRRRG